VAGEWVSAYGPLMTSKVSRGASGAIHRFAGAEERAATWIYQYCTGTLPPGQPKLDAWEVQLY
jgi:hypothetical protein